jgi:hypothetical protein
MCGARSTLSLEIPTTEARTWTQDCPVCGRPWKLKIWIRRGLPELIVEPGLQPKGPKAKSAAKPAKKPAKKKKK